MARRDIEVFLFHHALYYAFRDARGRLKGHQQPGCDLHHAFHLRLPSRLHIEKGTTGERNDDPIAPPKEVHLTHPNPEKIFVLH